MTSPLKQAYLGMQCFWGVESTFAKLGGVKKLGHVGYAGGDMLNPTYANIGDHTEITEVQYDENLCSYKEILDWFSRITIRHQKATAEEALKNEQKKYGSRAVQTYLKKLDKFYQAEDYHQKYWLRCQRSIFKQLKLSEAEVVNSVLAAKINAYLAGYDNFAELKSLATEYKLNDNLVTVIEEIARAGGDPRACH
uniref:peptide-methionine (S)-S-oxide reductase n=1 Tax=Ditylenchus dipsaci TaxID=166011 RepID=A0A915D1T7_9BILA